MLCIFPVLVVIYFTASRDITLAVDHPRRRLGPRSVGGRGVGGEGGRASAADARAAAARRRLHACINTYRCYRHTHNRGGHQRRCTGPVDVVTAVF